MEVTRLRSSDMDSLFSCTPSILWTAPVQVASESGEEAAKGKAVHHCAADLIETGDYNVPAALNLHGLDPEHMDDVLASMEYVVRAWAEVGRYFPSPKTEAVAESSILQVGQHSYQITSTLDVVSPVGETNAIFLDWKNGMKDNGYHNSQASYAYNLWDFLGRPEDCTITGIVVFLQHRYYRVTKYTPSMLKAWEYDLTHNVLPKREVFTPGRACPFCKNWPGCTARKEIVNGMMDAILLTGDEDYKNNPVIKEYVGKAKELLATLSPDNKADPVVGEALHDLLFRVRLAQRQLDDAKDFIRDAVDRVGSIPMPDGYELFMREVPIRSVDPAKGLKVARQYLSDGQIAECMRLSMPKLLAAYAAKHSKGEKGKAKAQLEKVLTDAGTVTVTVQRRVDERKIENDAADDDVSGNAPTGGPDKPTRTGGIKRAGVQRQPDVGQDVPASE